MMYREKSASLGYVTLLARTTFLHINGPKKQTPMKFDEAGSRNSETQVNVSSHYKSRMQVHKIVC